MLHATDIPISLLAVAANGLGADPNSADWRDWRDLLPAAHSIAADGQSVETAASVFVEPPFQLGDGIDCWASISTGSPSPRTEIIHEAHPTAKGMNGTDDGNGQVATTSLDQFLVVSLDLSISINFLSSFFNPLSRSISCRLS
jgi:hypothetical protein